MADYKLKKGYTISLEGEAKLEIVAAPYPKRIAIKPHQFLGIKPKLMVKEGAVVRQGSPLFHNKIDERHVFTSPVSGKVIAIERGHRRVIEHIVIAPDQKDHSVEYKAYGSNQLSSLSRKKVFDQLIKSGALALFRQRPFDYVASPKIFPRDIFVSTFDTSPLAPDFNLIVQGKEAYFQAGLEIAAILTDGKVHLAIDGSRSDLSSAFTEASGVQINRFWGRHPCGCPGVQIHHIAPIRGKDDIVWYSTVPGMIMLGKLFLEGRIDSERIVAVTGSSAKDRRYFRTVLGADISSIVQENIHETVRYISGNILTGKHIDKSGFMGFYDTALTIIPESKGPEFIGWMLPGWNKGSFYRAFLSHLLPGDKKFITDTKINGGVRSFFSTGNYEQVLPMKLYPSFLCRSILAGDIEEMEGLGIYEVTEEEVALCEYICPSKIEIQKIVREGITMLEKEG